ncbi:hypothetical protein BH09ACT8_BH09ACT8_63140 [soil metagenome]
MNSVDSTDSSLASPHTDEANDLLGTLQARAKTAICDTDRDDICSDPFDEGCAASLDDGEGWDGACGNCADRQAAKEEGQWWRDGADDENNAEGSDR